MSQSNMAKWKSRALGMLIVSVNLFLALYLDSVSAGEYLPMRVPKLIREGELQAQLHRTTKEAIYRNQITCQGDIPYPFIKFPESLLSGSSPQNTFPSVLSLCALSSIGGSSTWTLEAYCAWKLSPPTVIFSNHPNPRRTILYGFWSQAAILCQARCRCLSDVESAYIQDTTIPSREVVESESNPNERITRNPRRAVLGPQLHFKNFQPINVYSLEPADHNDPLTYLAPDVLHMSTGVVTNILECIGPLPPTPLPLPFRGYEYTSLQGLCGSLHDSGDAVGNLGGICLKEPELLVFSAIHMHPGFTRRGDMYALAAYVWCLLHCGCNGQDPKKGITLQDQNGIENDYEADFSNGGLVLRSEGKDGTSQEETILQPDSSSSSSGGSEQQQCASDLDAKCSSSTYDIRQRVSAFMSSHISGSGPYRIIEDRRKVGLLPSNRLPLPDSEIASTLQSDSTSNICGGICSSNNDCASDISEHCRCVVDVPHWIAQKHGLAALFTQFSCLPLAVASTTLSMKGSRLGGRSIDSGFSCACNSTYVSRGCCGSLEGLVDGVDPQSHNTLDM